MMKLRINKQYHLPLCYKCKHYTHAVLYDNKEGPFVEIVCIYCLRKQLVDLLKNNEYKKAKALQDKHSSVFYQIH